MNKFSFFFVILLGLVSCTPSSPSELDEQLEPVLEASSLDRSLELIRESDNLPEGFVIDTADIVSKESSSGMALAFKDTEATSLVFATFQGDNLTNLFRTYVSDDILNLEDLLLSQSYTLGDVSNFYDAKGNQSSAQLLAFADILARAISNGEVGVVGTGSSSASELTTQGAADLICDLVTPPVEVCPQCQDQAEFYEAVVCDAVSSLVDVGRAAVNLPTAALESLLDIAESSPDIDSITERRERLRKCTGGELRDEGGTDAGQKACPEPLSIQPLPNPNPVKKTLKPGTGGYEDVTIGSSTDSGRPLILGVEFSRNASIGPVGRVPSITVDVSKLWMGPGEEAQIRVQFFCPSDTSAAKTASGTMNIYHNAGQRYAQPLSVPVELKCGDPITVDVRRIGGFSFGQGGIITSGGDFDLRASISGDSEGKGVTWSVTRGSINPREGNPLIANYTAPIVNAPGDTAVITATSVADPTAYDSFTVATIPISVTGSLVRSSFREVLSGSKFRLKHAISYDATGQGVTWTATGGSISEEDGLFYFTSDVANPSPSKKGSVTVTSVADSSKSRTQEFDIQAIDATVKISRRNQWVTSGPTLFSGQLSKLMFVDLENDASGQGYVLSVSSGNGGIISESTDIVRARFQAPDLPCHARGSAANRQESIVYGYSVADPDKNDTMTMTTVSTECPQ